MKTFTKFLAVFTVAFAIASTSHVVQAGCGSCEEKQEHKHDHDHKHKKNSCVKCEHAKSCDVQDCDDPAHQAECVCPKK